MSVESTSLRFELIKPKKDLKKFLQKEKERILRDEREADYEKQSRKDYIQIKMAEWHHYLDEFADRKRYKQNHRTFEKEVAHATKSVVAVRRAALEKVLKEDHEIHKQELAKIGKAFYVQRM